MERRGQFPSNSRPAAEGAFDCVDRPGDSSLIADCELLLLDEVFTIVCSLYKGHDKKTER